MRESPVNNGFNHFANNIAKNAPKEVLVRLIELRASYTQKSNQPALRASSLRQQPPQLNSAR